MKFTVRSSFGAPPAVADCSWPQIVSWLKDQALCAIDRKDQVTLCAFTEFVGGWKRENLGLDGLWALPLDFDKVPMGRVLDLVQDSIRICPGVSCLIHTTYQHGVVPNPYDPDHNPYARLRVIFPCDLPLSVGHYADAWGEAVQDFGAAGHAVDPCTGNPERTWYVPAINPSAPAWAKPWIGEYFK